MNVELILEKLEAKGLIRLKRIINEYYQIYCPIHNDGNETKPSCGVLLNEQVKTLPNGKRQVYPQGWVHCFTCGYSESLPQLVTDILKSKHISQTGLDWLIANIPGFDASNNTFDSLIPDELMTNVNNNFAIEYIQSLTNPTVNTYICEMELKQYRFTVPYMYQRRLTDAVIAEYDVGVDMYWVAPGKKKATPCITFPVRDESGNTLFIYRRAIAAKFFSMPDGLTKPVYGLYELPKEVKTVIICEAILNALTARTYGYHAVALMGTGNQYQIQQLRLLGVSEFVICMDNDDAGRRATRKLKRALSDVAIVWAITMPIDKDVNDCEKSEFDELYELKE